MKFVQNKAEHKLYSFAWRTRAFGALSLIKQTWRSTNVTFWQNKFFYETKEGLKDKRPSGAVSEMV